MMSNLSQALYGLLDSTIYLETVSRISGITVPMTSLEAEVDHFPSFCGWATFTLPLDFLVFYPQVHHRREWCHHLPQDF